MTRYTFSTQALSTLLSFPFKDPEWQKKAVIGIAITLSGFFTLGITIFFVSGYFYRIMRRIIIEDGEPFLPEWDDWGRLFIDGLRLSGAGLIFTLPTIIVLFVSFIAWIIAISLASNAPPSSGSGLILLPGLVIMTLGIGLAIILSLATSVFSPAAMAHVAARGSFKAFFQFNNWWQVWRANISGFLISCLLAMLLSFAAILPVMILNLTFIFSCLSPLLYAITLFYVLLVSYPLFAQVYRNGVENLESSAGDTTIEE